MRRAAAGHVIEAFGAFLIGGNFAVGLFVFMILMIINLVVVTKGAGRVSEVSARFTLDALPGKQMAIDADLAAGLMTADAKARRREVATEADFYGAMDGASKFVKGDAIAALLILGVNIIAGFCLGMLSHGLTAGSSQRYVTLAVGDALVAQVPSLLLSTAAVIVTRVADTRDLAGQIGHQFANPATWLPVAIILGAIGAIPAMPHRCSCLRRRRRAGCGGPCASRAPAGPGAGTRSPPSDPSRITLDEVSDHTLVTIELGYGLVHLVDERRGSPLVTPHHRRASKSQSFGFVVPPSACATASNWPQRLSHHARRVPLGGAMVHDACWPSMPAKRGPPQPLVGDARPQLRLPGAVDREPCATRRSPRA
jgi:flagellar biosynthesis protein FlhA